MKTVEDRPVYRFQFLEGVSLQSVENSLILALIAVQGLHGRAQVRLDASFLLEEKKRACVIDVSTDVGKDLARIFTGFLVREFGEERFSVEKVTTTQADNAPSGTGGSG